MAQWYADGGVSGFSIEQNTPIDALPALNREAGGKLVVAGSVDTQGITRLQYPVAGQYFRRRIDVVARVKFTQAEINEQQNQGRNIGVSVFVLDASVLAPGVVPTPQQIFGQVGSGQLYTYRREAVSLQDYIDATNGVVWDIAGHTPLPNRKYWVMVAPTSFVSGSEPSAFADTPMGDVNTVCRAISVWSNRRPLAPTITSPGPDTVYGSGDSFDLTFLNNDPDEIGGSESNQHTDGAGVQVQYAPKATPENPTPQWIDLPIATRTGNLVAAQGWYIDQTSQAIPSDINNNGAYFFWALGTMKVRCGSSTLAAGQGVLPSGDWQIRVRTFDYGHPYPRHAKPLASANGNYTASTFPETNTSPWSTPVRVSVASQVPSPTPLSPSQNIAIPEDRAITLSWKYRNTAMPPFAQGRREVQIRKVRDPDWTTVINDFSALSSYTLTSTPGANPVVPYQYLADGGFENGIDGWAEESATASLSKGTGTPPTSRTGTGHLLVSGSGAVTVSKIIPLLFQHTVFSLSGYTFLGSGSSTSHKLVLVWLNNAGDPVQAATIVNRPAGSGWVRVSIDNAPRPAGATKVQIGVIGAGNSGGDRYDDFSFTGTGGQPVEVPFVPEATNQYEWRVRTTDTTGAVSSWSPVARFFSVPTPESGSAVPLPTETIDGASLGCGTYRVRIVRRGGTVDVGEVTDISYLEWNRVRDDISTARIVVSGYGIDCGNLLAQLQTWAYEVVIFRNNGFSTDRVWEGPITLLTYGKDTVTIQAKDMMAFTYRRIIRQRMNDSVNGDSVTSRAGRILQNVFAPDDPNVLVNLRVLTDAGDGKQYRNVPPYARTAFEEIDDMASNSGLDYCAVGRSILVWGTKRRIGTLPEFRDNDLGASPIVSEYGMSFANSHVVSDGNGIWGEAVRNRDPVSGNDDTYGLVETLSSSWASDSPEDTGSYTQEGLATIQESFKGFAERTISRKFPPPVVVRVPDNTSLSPDIPISIQHLVPGVVIPLRSTATLRKVAADQKLDSVKVTYTDKGETVQITLSPFSREDNETVEGEG